MKWTIESCSRGIKFLNFEDGTSWSVASINDALSDIHFVNQNKEFSDILYSVRPLLLEKSANKMKYRMQSLELAIHLAATPEETLSIANTFYKYITDEKD